MVPWLSWLICVGFRASEQAPAFGRLYPITQRVHCRCRGRRRGRFLRGDSWTQFPPHYELHRHSGRGRPPPPSRPPEYCSSRHHASSFPSSPRGRRKAPQEEEWRDSLTRRTQHHPPPSLSRHINDAAVVSRSLRGSLWAERGSNSRSIPFLFLFPPCFRIRSKAMRAAVQ